jgi:hypothetical protein
MRSICPKRGEGLFHIRLEGGGHQLKQAPKTGTILRVLLLMRMMGIETADVLVKAILSRNMRDRFSQNQVIQYSQYAN